MILGVIGKIASGKSEVLKILEKEGFYCIKADKIVHDLYRAGGEGAKRIAAVFGKKFLNEVGGVDRIKLRNEVFNDEAKLKMLNNIIHPIVYGEIVRLLASVKHGNVAIELVYFDQNFLEDFVDEILWVERGKEDILKVLLEERGFDRELAEKAVNLVEKPKAVNVLLNDGNLADLEEKVHVICRKFKI